MVAKVIFTELASIVSQIQQELSKRRGAWPQVRGAAWQLRRNHASPKRRHTYEERVAPRSATRLRNVVHENSAIVSDAVDVRCFTHHQAAMIDAGLHPANVVTHDEKDVGFTSLPLRNCRRAVGEQRNRWCQ